MPYTVKEKGMQGTTDLARGRLLETREKRALAARGKVEGPRHIPPRVPRHALSSASRVCLPQPGFEPTCPIA